MMTSRFAAPLINSPRTPTHGAMTPFVAEFVGTAILVLLGDGVVANVVLARSKGHNSGWFVITAGWAFAVTIAAYSVGSISGAHLNPAVTIGLALIGKFAWAQVPGYVLAQLGGGVAGAVLVWLAYLPHWGATTDPEAKLAVFCTAPAIRNPLANLVTEAVATGMLMLALLTVLSPANFVPGSDLGKGVGPLLVGVIVWSIGLSLGGSTGYAINPARDLGPRIAHALLPVSGKSHSDWSNAWVPVVGPLCGGAIGALIYRALWPV